jgi:hypothetical protein
MGCDAGVESGDGSEVSADHSMRQTAIALLHQAIVQPHQLTVIVILQDELSWPHLGLFSQQDLGAEVALQFVKGSADVRVVRNACWRNAGACAARSEAFDLPDRQPAARGAVRIAHSELRVGNRQ